MISAKLAALGKKNPPQALTLCPVKLLQLADCHLIPAPNATAITNANTPEDYENIRRAQILR
ncbi:MAG: hypothetical protein ACK5CA_00435 [Cyanobacteriota bacterium]